MVSDFDFTSTFFTIHLYINTVSESEGLTGRFLDVLFPPWYDDTQSFSTLDTRVLKNTALTEIL